jgi:hypothetical protein
MPETLERLKGQLEHLSTEDKLELAHFLLVSLEPEEDGVAAAWDQEIQSATMNLPGVTPSGRLSSGCGTQKGPGGHE